MKIILHTLLSLSFISVAELPEQLVLNAKKYTKEINSTISDKLKNGQNGYLIITTAKIAKESKLLKQFIKHKQKLGFSPKVITEAEYGKAEGQQKAANIRKWLQNNYQKNSATYALLLGSPHPFHGDIPHQLIRRGQVDKSYSIRTDYTYSDLTGELDPNHDKVVCDEKKDVNQPGGPNGIADIYVGRIPFSDIPKIDNYFKQVIKFENQSANLTNRHNALFVSLHKENQQKWNRVKNEFMSPLNARSFTISDGDDGWFEKPQITSLESSEVIETINKHNFGFIGFSNSAYSYGLINSLKIDEKDSINPSKRAGIAYIGNCDAAHPEAKQNITGVILDKMAVGVYSGTSNIKIKKKKSTEDFGFYNLAALGWSNGEILARYNTSIIKSTGKSPNVCYNITLFGDPSIIAMPSLGAGQPAKRKKQPFSKTSLSYSFDKSSASFKHKIVSYGCGGGGCGVKIHLSDLKLVEGKIKKAMKFNGRFNKYGGAIADEKTPDALRDDYHLSFWLKLDKDAKKASIIKKEDSWDIAIENNQLIFKFFQNSFDENTIVETRTKGVDFDQHYWNKIEMKIDRSEEELTGWLNGKLVGKAKLKAKLPSGSESIIMIGQGCQGIIDELEIKNYIK